MIDDTASERACERLVLDFAYFSDRRDYESLADLFVTDGAMIRPSGDPLIGREAIIESYQSRGAGRITRHVCTNIRITLESANRPEAHFGIKADARQLIGEFEDEFVRTTEGWRIESRRARFVMHT